MIKRWISYFYVVMGILTGIIIVSTIRHGEMNVFYIGRTVAVSAFLFFYLFLIWKAFKRISAK